MGRDLVHFCKRQTARSTRPAQGPVCGFFHALVRAKVELQGRHHHPSPRRICQQPQALNWPFDFRDLLDQPMLMRDHLEADRAEMESMPADDIIGQSALLWRMIYRSVHADPQAVPRLQSCPPRRPFPRPRCRV